MSDASPITGWDDEPGRGRRTATTTGRKKGRQAHSKDTRQPPPKMDHQVMVTELAYPANRHP